MAVDATHVAQFAVAALYFALAAWLLYLNFPSRIHRVLSLLIFLRGGAIALNQLFDIQTENALYWHSVRTHFFIAIAFVIVDWLIVYTWRQSSPARRGARRFLLGTFLAFEVAYLLDHSLLWTFVTPSRVTFGSMAFVSRAFLPLLAIAGLWFAWLARNAGEAVQAKFHRLFSLAFITAAIAEAAGTFYFVLVRGWNELIARTGDDTGGIITQLVILSTVPIAFIASCVLLYDGLKAGATTRSVWQAAIIAFALLLPLVALVIPSSADSHSLIFFSAMPRAFAPSVMAYALARQVASRVDPFQLDLRTGIVLRKGTVGGVMIAFFFVVSESAAQVFGQFAATQNLSPVVAQVIGIVGAGILLVFLHPLNRLGEKLATGVMPTAKPLAQLEINDRLRIYKEQVELAWADGSITRKERLLLDKLRDQLRLPLGETARLESRAVRGLAGPA